MELRQLEYVVAVAEEENFTRAAARMHVTQPGLSAQIAALERELGQTLFQRGRHGARLTEVGAAVLADAREALAAAGRIRGTADEYSGLLRGEVRIGFVSGAASVEFGSPPATEVPPSLGPSGPGMAGFDVGHVLAGFRHDHPQVRVRLSEHDTDTMVEALAAGTLDIAIIGITGAPLPAGIGTDIIVDGAVVAAVADGSRRLPKGPVPLARLAGEPLICLPPGTGIRGVFQRACEAAGLTPDVAYEAAAPPVLLRLAAHGLGVAIVPELTAADAEAFGVRAHPITRPRLRGQLALAWNTPRHQTPATKVLLGQLRIAFAPRR